MKKMGRIERDGFSLDSVCWGYREIFARAIQGLYDEGMVGEGREEVTSKFFRFMRCSDRTGFDHVLKEFLGSLNPRTRWIMDLPGIFGDVVDVGRRFAESKMYFGIGYFKTLGEGGFGETPRQVRDLMTHVRRLRETDEELAFAFLKGYRTLTERLEPQEIVLYLHEGLKIFAGSRKAGLAFMEASAKSSESVMRTLTRECRLEDAEPVARRLLRALTGVEVEMSHLGGLDSDELIERGTNVVCMYKWLYVPIRVRWFDSERENRRWYTLLTVTAAGMLSEGSFPCIHGHPEYATCADLVGDDTRDLNLFQIIEYVRVLRAIRRKWPGARGLVEWGMTTEFRERPARTGADRLLRDALKPGEKPNPAVQAVEAAAEAFVNCFDTARNIRELPIPALLECYPGLDEHPLRTFGFLSDFLYPASVSDPPADGVIADMKRRAGRDPKDEPDDAAAEAGADAEGEEKESVVVGFVYDEWSQPENDYHRDHCIVRERVPPSNNRVSIPDGVTESARRVRRAFELLRPDVVRREKRLDHGDLVNPDLLIEYIVNRRKEPSPRINFYEKPLISRRDLAVLIVIDVSGSTGEEVDSRKIIDLEKHAAVILGQGLAALGDRFSLCGFSGNGRENCEYLVFKDLDEEWGRESQCRLMAAHPMSGTRIGAALRHSGYRLSSVEAKHRLIILVTDGKPMDVGYDPESRYAQFDVRMACAENLRQGIHTFGISTEENSLAEMEIMFPNRRFVILPDIRKLPDVLPRMYLRMTA